MLTLPAKLTVTEARSVLAGLVSEIDALPAADKALLDARALTHFDSSALAVLLSLRRHCKARGRSFETTQVPPRLGGLAKLYGVAELL